RGIAEHAGGDLPDTEKIDRQQREDGAELNQHGEGLAEIVIVEAEEVLDQEQVAGRGHRQELGRSEEHTSELQSLTNLVCRLLLDTAPPDIYTLPLHDALPISRDR